MCTDRFPKRAAQTGLSLVEIMVGMLIAMIGVVVIFQMLAQSEERKRTASAGSDVQISGIISTAALERDVREGGYGFASAAFDTGVTPLMGCTVNAFDLNRPINTYTFRLTPIQIIQGIGGAPDTLIVLRGNSPTTAASLVFTESTDTSKKTRGRAGLAPRDYVLVASSSPTLQCMLTEITDVSDPDALTINHNLGTYTYTVYLPDGSTSTQSRIARFNNGTPPVTFTAGFLFNLGNGARRNIWTAQNGKLQVTNDLLYQDTNGDGVNDPVEIADGVVNLQAEYGIDANNNGRIDAGEWTTADPVTTEQWANILAVRIGMLIRSGQFEKTPVTTAVPGWAGGTFTVTNLDGSASSTSPAELSDNWRHYRYRVYETVIPLRNMLWGSQIRP